MARKSRRSLSDVDRYTSSSSRPPSFGDDPEDDAIASGTSFFLMSLAVFLVILFGAVYFGTENIEENLVSRSQASLQAAGFNQVDVTASGATVHLSGAIATDQLEEQAFGVVASLVGVNEVEGKLWPVFTGELSEIEVTGDAIEIDWSGHTVVVKGSVATEDRKVFVSESLSATFSTVDTDQLTVLEGLVEAPQWLGTSLGLVISLREDLEVGKMIIDPNQEMLIVGGDVIGKDLRNELNEKISDAADDLGYDVTPAIREIKVGPTKEDVEELQVNLNELIAGKVVEFETKSYALTDEGISLLDEILEALRQAPEVRVLIGGHTDSRGSTEDNLQLSTDRANAVLDYLVMHGEPPERFDVIGYGETQPADTNNTSTGRARNRRIEFTALLDETAEESP